MLLSRYWAAFSTASLVAMSQRGALDGGSQTPTIEGLLRTTRVVLGVGGIVLIACERSTSKGTKVYSEFLTGRV